MEKDRFYTLDDLKGIAILFVIITHYDWTESQRLRYGFPFTINMAVPIFMLISGYSWALSYNRKNVNILGECYDLRLLLKKYIRFTVPFCSLFLLDIIYMLAAGIVKSHTYSFWDYINIFINGGPGPGAYYYTLLLQLAILFPFIYFAVKKYNFKGVILIFAVNFLFEIGKKAFYITADTYRLILLRYAFLLSFGVWLCENNEIPFSRKQISAGICMLSLGCAFIIATQYCGYQSVIFSEWTGTSLPAVFLVCPIVAVILKYNCNIKFLSYLGRRSYDIFIVQTGFYAYFAKYVYMCFESVYLRLLCCLCICLIGGITLYSIEKGITAKIILGIDNQCKNRTYISE